MPFRKTITDNVNLKSTQWCDLSLYALTGLWICVSSYPLTELHTLLLIASVVLALLYNILTVFIKPHMRNSTQVRIIDVFVAVLPFAVLCGITGSIASPYLILLIAYCFARLIKTEFLVGNIIIISLFLLGLFGVFTLQIYARVYEQVPADMLFIHIEQFVKTIRHDPTALIFSSITGLGYVLLTLSLTRRKSIEDVYNHERCQLLKSTKSIVVTVNPHTIVQAASGALSQFFGDNLLEQSKLHLINHVHTDDRSAFKNYVKNGTITSPMRSRFMSPAGNYRWVKCQIISRSPHANFASLMLTPGHEESVSQESVVHRRARANLLANMSHELRTPLNAVIGFSEVLQNEAFGPLGSPQNEEYLQMIHDSGQHMLFLINELLDLTQIESLNEGINPEPILNWVSVDSLINECVQLTTHRIKPMGGRITFDPMGPENFNLLADRTGLKQIIRALLMVALFQEGKTHHVHIRAHRLHTTLKINFLTKLIEPPTGFLNYPKNSFDYMASLNLDVAKKYVEMISGRISLADIDRNGEGCVTLAIPHRRPSKFFDRNNLPVPEDTPVQKSAQAQA